MTNESKEPVLPRLRKQLESGRLDDNVSVVYRVQGGVEGEQLNESVLLTASGSTRVQISDGLKRRPGGDVRGELGREAVLELVRAIAAGIDDLVPRSEARFLPDSLVGSISIGIGDETETYYFDADDDALGNDDRSASGGVRAIVGNFERIEKRCLAGGTRNDKEGR